MQRTEVFFQCKRMHFCEVAACSVCRKLGVYIQQLPITALQCEISSTGEGQPDEIPEEAAPNSNSNDEEWWPDEVELKQYTIGIHRRHLQ